MQPAALLRQGGLIATEGIDSIDEGCRHITAGSAVAVNLNLLSSLIDTNATHGLLHFLDGTIGIEEELINLYRTALVITGRESILMIEQIPLTFIIYDAVMVGPTAILMFWHDEALILVRSHWILTHGIAKNLGILPDIRIGQVIIAIILKGKRSLGLTVRKVFQTVDTIHLKLTIAKLHFLLRSIVSQFLHIGFELSTTASTPEDVRIAIRSLEYTGVDTANTFDRFRFTDERSLRTVCDSNTNAKATTILRS